MIKVLRAQTFRSEISAVCICIFEQITQYRLLWQQNRYKHMSFRTMAAIWLVHSMLVQITLIFIVNKKRNGKKKKNMCVHTNICTKKAGMLDTKNRW